MNNHDLWYNNHKYSASLTKLHKNTCTVKGCYFPEGLICVRQTFFTVYLLGKSVSDISFLASKFLRFTRKYVLDIIVGTLFATNFGTRVKQQSGNIFNWIEAFFSLVKIEYDFYTRCAPMPGLLKLFYEKCMYVPIYLSTYVCLSVRTVALCKK